MYKNIIQFVVMFLTGIFFNPMNILAYRLNDLYLSKTLMYGGLLMASNMIWSHEIVHYLAMNHFNSKLFIFGIILSIIISQFLLRDQFNITDKDWLERMISHHSTALTTSEKISKRTKDKKIKKLADDIYKLQDKEISLMKGQLIKLYKK